MAGRTTPPVVCGIAGGSGAGKSTLAEALVRRLASDGVGVVVLPFDEYYRDQGHLDPEARSRVNYDHPDALDLGLFAGHLADLAAGRAVDAPVYDFATHRRTAARRLEPRPVVVTEGILLLAGADVRELLDLTVFVDAPEPLRLERRIARDVRERGRTPAGVRQQFAETVAPMFERHVAPYAVTADLRLDGTGDVDLQAAHLAGLLVGGGA